MTVGDTTTISQGIGAFASRQAINAGSSALIAGENVKTQIVRLAARVLGVPDGDIDVEEGRASARGGNKPSLTFGELARMAQGMPGFSFAADQAPGLEHTAYFTPPQASYCNGTHVAEVEVDPMTGEVELIGYTVAHDSGRIINPLIVDGQVQGGVAHGIGNALFEWMKYDADAQPLTTTFQDYLLPAAPDVPSCRIEHVETPNPLNPLGVKGAGEGGTIPAPAAIVSAIEDALAPFGVHFAEMPLTPARIVEALHKAGAYRRQHERSEAESRVCGLLRLLNTDLLNPIDEVEARMRSNAESPRLRSQLWFDNPDNPGMTALYLERYLNYGLDPRGARRRQADHRHRADGL